MARDNDSVNLLTYIAHHQITSCRSQQKERVGGEEGEGGGGGGLREEVLLTGMVSLAPKWVRLDPKLDKSGTFSDQISVHLL